jgi:hypothetical protein
VKEQTFSKYFFRFYCWVTKALMIRSPLPLAAPMTIGNPTTTCATWQEVFLQTFLSFLTELSDESQAAEDEKRMIFQQEFSQYASEFFTILLSPLVTEEKAGKSSEENKTEKMKPVEVENELNKEQSLQIISSKLFSKENHGNASLFWNQKLFAVVLPFLSNAILPPPAPVAATPMTSFSSPFTQRMTAAPLLSTSSSIVDEKTFNRKFLHYMFLCQLISLSPSSIRKLNISPLFDCFKMILTACSQMERVSSSSTLSSSLTAISLLERELFPSLELLIQENPALFGDSLHLIIPRLTKVSETGKKKSVCFISFLILNVF